MIAEHFKIDILLFPYTSCRIFWCLIHCQKCFMLKLSSASLLKLVTFFQPLEKLFSFCQKVWIQTRYLYTCTMSAKIQTIYFYTYTTSVKIHARYFCTYTGSAWIQAWYFFTCTMSVSDISSHALWVLQIFLHMH